MIGTPFSTAASIGALSTFPSVQLTVIPSTPLATSCSIACACFCASSPGGVCQSILISTPSFADSSFAASNAPVFAAWNTGLLWLLAITPIVKDFLPDAGAAAFSAGLASAALSAPGVFCAGLASLAVGAGSVFPSHPPIDSRATEPINDAARADKKRLASIHILHRCG